MKGTSIPTEEDEQRTLAQYLDLILPGLWFHVPNGGMRNKAEGGKLKAQGVKKGVPDNWIILPPPMHPQMKGTVIELKRVKGGSVSAEQRKWIETLLSLGWMAVVCKGADEAIAKLMQLGYSTPQVRQKERKT